MFQKFPFKSKACKKKPIEYYSLLDSFSLAIDVAT